MPFIDFVCIFLLYLLSLCFLTFSIIETQLVKVLVVSKRERRLAITHVLYSKTMCLFFKDIWNKPLLICDTVIQRLLRYSLTTSSMTVSPRSPLKPEWKIAHVYQ